MKPSHSKIVLFGLLAIIIALFIGCGWASDEPIKIGFVAGFTGSSAELSVTARNGVLMAVDEYNKTGGVKGRKIQMLIEDDKSDKEIAFQADKSLIDKGVPVIIGHIISGVTEKTVPLINEKKVLMLSPTISMDRLTGIDDFFFRVIPTNAAQGNFLAEQAYKNKAKKIAIFYDENNGAFATAIIDTFTTKIRALGGEVVINASFRGTAGDHEHCIALLKASEADGVLLVASSSEAAYFCQQMMKNGIKTPVYLPMWSMTNDLVKLGGPAVEGVYLNSLVDFASTEEKFIRFRNSYRERYGSEPTFGSVLGYESVIVLVESMRMAKDLSSEGIKNAILKKERFSGLQGEIVIDRFGDTTKKYYLYTVRNGQYVKAD